MPDDAVQERGNEGGREGKREREGKQRESVAFQIYSRPASVAAPDRFGVGPRFSGRTTCYDGNDESTL